MKVVLKISSVLFLVLGLAVSQANDSVAFMQVESETFDKEDFVFPDDLRATGLNVVYLAMSKDQDNGQYQGQVLMEWNAALTEAGLFSDEILAYQFAVIKAPFFIKGVIRNAMRDDFEGNFPLDRSGILFVGDLEEFAETAGLPLDDQATIVLVSPEGKILRVFDGEPTEEGVESVVIAATELGQAELPDD
jgi:hypothetical protein